LIAPRLPDRYDGILSRAELEGRLVQVDQIVEQMLADPTIASNVAAYREVPARQAEYEDFPERCNLELLAALRSRGIHRLYAHQRDAIDAVLAGRDVVVVTPTASGKTLCYNLPVLDAILADDNARALYVFPTKALSQDQVHELQAIVDTLGAEVKTHTFDGDTPQTVRKAIREAGHIVVTNPDMLHTGVLPHHTRWYRLFENLRYVVVDELHVYRGVFGSHVANVIRRLKRICRYYGSDPLFICCSATIANPAELAERIIEKSVRLVDTNGAPSGKKHVLLYNPPVVNRQLGLRSSSRLAARDVAVTFLRNNVQTIVFSRSRTGVELLLQYLRDAVGSSRRNGVRGYRSGYLPLQRREIERGLRDGSVRAVVATNALELGIDIGALDACVVTGFPGTIASAWQQMGRAGRRSDSSVAVLVFNSSALDQFLATHPDYFFGQPPEAGLIDPNNLLILVSHLKCAAFELPFHDDEHFGVETTADILRFLEENEVLHHRDGVWHWTSDSFPAQEVSLRSAATDNVVIIDRGPPARVVGEIDRSSAPTMLHEEAIYIHEGQQYQVEELDLAEKKAYVTAVDVDYYTDAEQAVKIRVLEVAETSGGKTHGDVEVTYLPTIFKKIKLHTHENVGWGNIYLDEDPFPTTAFWFTVPEHVQALMPRGELETGLRAIAHVLGQVAPVYLMCDPADLAAWSELRATFTLLPTIFLYDRVPGGVGFSARLFRLHRQLLASAGDLVTRCPCEHGCPSCIGPRETEGTNPKLCAIRLLGVFLDEVALPARR
jgi:DEAD/DEAH box helicase domain-containing protein